MQPNRYPANRHPWLRAAVALTALGVGVRFAADSDWVRHELGFAPVSADEAPPATTVALSPPAALETPTTPAPAAEKDPFAISWYDAPDGSKAMVIGGEDLVHYQHDPQWQWPKNLIPTNPEDSSGCMCGDTVYATGISMLTGQYTRPDSVYSQLASLGGHEADQCGGMPVDREIMAKAYGFAYQHLPNLQAAQDYVTTTDPNAFVIIGQKKIAAGDGFSPYGSHIIGLMWDQSAGAWRAFDPNDYQKTESQKLKEPELQDVTHFWATDQITNVYDVAVWSNPNGVPTQYAWQTS